MARIILTVPALLVLASQGSAFTPSSQNSQQPRGRSDVQSSVVQDTETQSRTSSASKGKMKDLWFVDTAPAISTPRSSSSVTVQEPQELPSAAAVADPPAAPPAASTGGEQRRKILKEPALWEYNFGLQDPGIELPHGIESRVTPAERYELTEEQIQTLERDGVVHVKGVFDADWVEYLRSATSHQVSNPHFWAFAGTASRLYDYIQRNIWQTNRAFADFYYHSAVGHVLAQCGRTDEIRVSTDLLMVNPNKGFKWHQDNQNGPITWDEGIRFWITMDETPAEYGAPVYLRGSHRNDAVSDAAVFVDIDMDGLEEYRDDWLEFRTMPGDMLIWHPRTIHKVDGPADGIWTSYRRVLGGTAAKSGSLYHDKRGTGGVLSDLGRHGLEDGMDLRSPFFPMVFPSFEEDEARARDNGRVGRDARDIVGKLGGLVGKASGEKFSSFFQVLGSQAKK